MSQTSICSYDKYQYKAIPSTDYHHNDLEISSSFNLNITKTDDYNNNNDKNNRNINIQLTSKTNGCMSRITIIVLICCVLLLVGLSYFGFHTNSNIVTVHKDDMIVSGEL